MAIRSLASLALLLPLAACASSPPAVRASSPLPPQAPQPGNPDARDQVNLSFAVGRLNYAARDFGPGDDQLTLGLAADFSRLGTWGWEVGGYFSGSGTKSLDDDAVEASAESSEFFLGSRYNFQTGNEYMQPFVGVGLTHIWAKRDPFDGSQQDADDGNLHGGAVAAYAHAGVRWFISPDASIGFDWRYANSGGLDVFSFGDDDVRPDYHLFTFFLGLRF